MRTGLENLQKSKGLFQFFCKTNMVKYVKGGRNMDKSLGKKSSVVFGILALILLAGVCGSLLLKTPEAAGGPLQTNAAAAVTFEPGNYTAQLNVDILAVPESGAATIGRLQKSAQFKVFEIRQQGDSWYGKIAETADNWALLKDEKINYAIMTPQEGA